VFGQTRPLGGGGGEGDTGDCGRCHLDLDRQTELTSTDGICASSTPTQTTGSQALTSTRGKPADRGPRPGQSTRRNARPHPPRRTGSTLRAKRISASQQASPTPLFNWPPRPTPLSPATRAPPSPAPPPTPPPAPLTPRQALPPDGRATEAAPRTPSPAPPAESQGRPRRRRPWEGALSAGALPNHRPQCPSRRHAC
jgi:hypothetical protein